MKFLVFSLLLGLTHSQTLNNITGNQNEVVITPVDRGDQSCKCMPYYLCNDKNEGVNANNRTVTGFGQLEFRMNINDKCPVTNDICCTLPKDPNTPKPMPNPMNVKGCGYRNPNGIGATLIGANSQFGEFPWVVALLNRSNDSFVGAGVLISPNVVMTAAHIAFKFAANGLMIRAGEWNTQTKNEIFDYQERNIEEIYLHSGFNNDNLHNDIALLRLSEPLELVEHINVICMPGQDEDFDAYKGCIANGWGKDMFGRKGRAAVILKKVEINMVPHDTCNSLFRKTRVGRHFQLDKSFVCAGGEEGKDTCEGDGGAPLACPIGNDRYKLTGLVAWGLDCGEKDIPAAYTNVAMFRQWVDDKMAAWGYDTSVYKMN